MDQPVGPRLLEVVRILGAYYDRIRADLEAFNQAGFTYDGTATEAGNPPSSRNDFRAAEEAVAGRERAGPRRHDYNLIVPPGFMLMSTRFAFEHLHETRSIAVDPANQSRFAYEKIDEQGLRTSTTPPSQS
jgi:hypothetical protein